MNFCGFCLLIRKIFGSCQDMVAIFPEVDEESYTKVQLPLFGTGKEFIGECG